MWGGVVGYLNIKDKVILGLLVLLLIAGALWKLLQTRGPGLEFVELLPEEEQQQETITVHLVGEIKKPGVYHLAVGSRVYEALEQAGGVTEEADLVRINLARPLYDGEQLHIAGYGEQAPPPGEGKININQATEEELTALPGIGPDRARRIVEHREQYGYFTDITQLMEVSGIGEGIFGGLEEYITIY